MSEFREAVKHFRDAMREQSEHSACPSLPALLARERAAKNLRLRWALAAAAAMLMLGAIPIYRDQMDHRAAAQAQADAQLLQEVNAALSRSVPPALEPLMKAGN